MLHPVNKFQRRSPPHETLKHVQVARGIMRPRTHDIDLIGHEVIERHAVEPRKLSSLVERWRPLAELPLRDGSLVELVRLPLKLAGQGRW